MTRPRTDLVLLAAVLLLGTIAAPLIPSGFPPDPAYAQGSETLTATATLTHTLTSTATPTGGSITATATPNLRLTPTPSATTTPTTAPALTITGTPSPTSSPEAAKCRVRLTWTEVGQPAATGGVGAGDPGEWRFTAKGTVNGHGNGLKHHPAPAAPPTGLPAGGLADPVSEDLVGPGQLVGSKGDKLRIEITMTATEFDAPAGNPNDVKSHTYRDELECIGTRTILIPLPVYVQENHPGGADNGEVSTIQFRFTLIWDP